MSYVLNSLFRSILEVSCKWKVKNNEEFFILVGKKGKKRKKKSALQEIRNTWFSGRSWPEHSFE